MHIRKSSLSLRGILPKNNHKRQQFLVRIKKISVVLLTAIFLVAIYLLIKIYISKNNNQTTKVNLAVVDSSSDKPFLPVNLIFTNLSPDLYPNSSTSAVVSPIDELETFVSTQSSDVFQLDQDGELKQSSLSASINLIVNTKPEKSNLLSFYQTMDLVKNYFNASKVYLYDSNLFLRPDNLPDIIISVAMSKDEIGWRLQYLPQLIKAKPNVSLIDLRFKHPLVY